MPAGGEVARYRQHDVAFIVAECLGPTVNSDDADVRNLSGQEQRSHLAQVLPAALSGIGRGASQAGQNAGAHHKAVRCAESAIGVQHRTFGRITLEHTLDSAFPQIAKRCKTGFSRTAHPPTSQKV